jgi:arginyl-tRNA synthetase
MKEEVKKVIKKAVGKKIKEFFVEVPTNKKFGDYSTNIALVLAKNLGKNPVEVANEIKNKIKSKLFEKIEVAGPGFINFFITSKVVLENIEKIDEDYGKNDELKNKKVIIDYTDPNPFKEFHIGHLMSNAIGESLSRIFEFEGGKVKRVCYQGDVGIHVAKAIFGAIWLPQQKNIPMPKDDAPLAEKMSFWAQAYAFGASCYENIEQAKKEIVAINKKIFSKFDRSVELGEQGQQYDLSKVFEYYEKGKECSLEHFDQLYKKLNTKFDYFIFESKVSGVGKRIVQKGLDKDIFEEGENGAIIFDGEQFDLHTRVFINSEGLPTYEAKDLGLAEVKYEKYKYDKSVIVTGNEVNEYFKVVLKAMEQVAPALAKKTKHIGHGMLRLPEGKMSSRTGNVVTGESLLNQIEEIIKEKMKDRELSDAERKVISEKVAVGAIRYSILKQNIGSDIIYDFNKSVSFDGDSGPYLQYAHTRAQSVLRKAKEDGVVASFDKLPKEITQLERTINHFPEIVLQAGQSYEPHFILTYLTDLASEFNNYYTKNKIVDKKDENSAYRVALTAAFSQVMKNGMWLLGIDTLERM